MSETDTVREALIEMSALGARMFRNQVGNYALADGRRIISGLCPGSSDTIGWTPTLIGPEHIGRTIARFTAIEFKRSGGREAANQERFGQAVLNAGGIFGFAYSVEDAVRLIQQRF